MQISTILIITALILIFLVLLPDIMPYCASCNKYKLRPFFKMHKYIGILPGYNSSKSLCRSCCKKYGLSSFTDYKNLENARKRAILNSDIYNMTDHIKVKEVKKVEVKKVN